MTSSSRRNFIKQSALLAGFSSVATATRAAGAADQCDVAFEHMTSADAPHTAIKIIDTLNMPWSEPVNDRGWKLKLLYDNKDTGDHLVMISVPIGAPGGRNHYHDFHEWAYGYPGISSITNTQVLISARASFNSFARSISRPSRL